eukprot:1639081-Pyramimonas_sp.AAC.1
MTNGGPICLRGDPTLLKMPQLNAPSPEECRRYIAMPPLITPPIRNAMALPGQSTESCPKTVESTMCEGTKKPRPPARPPVPVGTPKVSLAEYPTLRNRAS